MQNYVSICEHQTRPNPALAAVHGQAALLLRYNVPTVSRELLAAALRTELPNDMVFAAIPFPFDALVFMLPKGTCVTQPMVIARSLFVTNLQRTEPSLTMEDRMPASPLNRAVGRAGSTSFIVLR